MNKLYAKYLKISDILSLADKHNYNGYQFKNAIESYLMAEQNGQDGLSQLKAVLPKKIYENVIFLLQTPYPGEINNLPGEMKHLPGEINNLPAEDFGHELQFFDNSFQFGHFEFLCSKQRMTLLREFGDIKAAECLMRYGTIITTSQHWCVPTLCYMKLVKYYGINYEGFASPINSQLLKLSRPFEYWTGSEFRTHAAMIKKPKFCTIFPEDACFGAIGSFFAQNWGGRHYAANTPYVPELMPLIADKVIESLQTPHTLCVIGLPNWTDAEWYIRLAKVAAEVHEFTSDYWFEENDAPINIIFKTTYMLITNEKKYPRNILRDFYKPL